MTGADTWATWSKAAPNFMYNQQITWDDTHSFWTYTPVKYWPNGIDLKNGGANDPSNTAEEAGTQYLSFFAYAPYKEVTATAYDAANGALPTGVTSAKLVGAANATGINAIASNDVAIPYVKYLLDQDVTNTVDLLWGLRGQKVYQETDNTPNGAATDELGATYNTDLTKQVVGEKVKFLFKHALAKVGGSTSSTNAAATGQQCGLKVVLDVDKNETANSTTAADHDGQATYLGTGFEESKTIVTLVDVKIRDKYTFDQEKTTPSGWQSDFVTEGWFNITDGTWSGQATKYTTLTNDATYSVEANQAGGTGLYILDPGVAEPATAPTPNAGAWSTVYVTTTPKNVYADNQEVPGLTLIPGNDATSNTLYVTVTYKVRTADANLSAGTTEVTQTITNKVELTGTILQPNKYYTLVMHLGLTSVKFEAVVADWSLTDGTYTDGGQENAGSGNHTTSVWLPSNVVVEP